MSKNKLLSGWQDSNLRPPHPKCGAIPGYATPRTISILLKMLERCTLFNEPGGEGGIRTRGTVTRTTV